MLELCLSVKVVIRFNFLLPDGASHNTFMPLTPPVIFWTIHYILGSMAASINWCSARHGVCYSSSQVVLLLVWGTVVSLRLYIANKWNSPDQLRFKSYYI